MMPATQYRTILAKYEEFALAQPQIDIPVSHRIHGGMYARQITIPAGVTITGQIYKYDHLEFMISGDATVASETGPARLKGYHSLSGHSGKKRAITAHEDTIWMTVHPSNGTNGEQIQNLITVKDFDELEKFYTEQESN
tara:strand:+ start:5003 stop:5419 length:417 start_codon:yes stop_codon:yes gene_type:complete